MTTRKQKVKALMESLRPLRRHMVFGHGRSSDTPRVTPSQWSVLFLIEDGSVHTVKDVALALGVTSSAATQLIDGLVKNRYVTRKTSKRDRRTVSLSLSQKTKTHVATMKKRALQKFVTMFAALSDREFDQYIALNTKIMRSLIHKNTQ